MRAPSRSGTWSRCAPTRHSASSKPTWRVTPCRWTASGGAAPAAKPGVRPSLEDPAAYVEANVTATARVFDAARRAGIARVVFGARRRRSTGTRRRRRSPRALRPWSRSRLTPRPSGPASCCAYAFATSLPLRIICLRFFTVYGPRQRPDLAIHRFTDLIARGQPGAACHGDGSSERDYTYIAIAWTVSWPRWREARAPRPRARSRC